MRNCTLEWYAQGAPWLSVLGLIQSHSRIRLQIVGKLSLMPYFTSNRLPLIALACLFSGCASTGRVHIPVESIEIQGYASDGVTPDPAKKLTLHQNDIEAMVAESWPTDNYPILANSKLSYSDRNVALMYITIFAHAQGCKPPFKMLEIKSQASSSESLSEIWTAQMCGTSKWNVAMTDGQVNVTSAR